MAPVVDRLKGEYDGRVEFRLINVDTDPQGEQLAQQFGAPGWPTFVFLDATGARVNQIVGATPESNLRTALDALD